MLQGNEQFNADQHHFDNGMQADGSLLVDGEEPCKFLDRLS
jgi:hypothetical protein